jgi:hypothetical protein
LNAVTPQQIHQQNARVPAASQATHIEQARAIAEVQAMFLMAKQAPRNEGEAIARALEACGQYQLAERAFYSFPRGGESVNGPSIGLATELARCWGNIDYGIMELTRNDDAGHTEMLAFARDLETNTRSHQTFIVPHARDTRSGRKALTDMRDIYENNANNGARRLRECIFRVLPIYLRAAAEDRCREVLQKGKGDLPIAQRTAQAISAFKEIGITLDRLEAKQGNSGNWTGVELANLEIAYRSIKRGETTSDEAFPRVKETAEDVTAEVRALAAGKAAQTTAEAIGDDLPETLKGNPFARAEEDEQSTEQTDEEPIWVKHYDALRQRIAKASTIVDVNNLETEVTNMAQAIPEDAGATLRNDIDAARERLSKKAK